MDQAEAVAGKPEEGVYVPNEDFINRLTNNFSTRLAELEQDRAMLQATVDVSLRELQSVRTENRELRRLLDELGASLPEGVNNGNGTQEPKARAARRRSGS